MALTSDQQLTPAQHQSAAEALLAAELTRQWIEPFSATYPAAEISDAYAVGQIVTDLKVKAGRTVKGYKVGLTSKAMRSTFDATEPDYGTLFDDWFLDEGSTIPHTRLNRPLVEIEMLFVLRADLGGSDVNALDVINATEYVVPAVEVVDSRYTRRGDAGVVDSIADAASCGFVIAGASPRRLTDIDIRQVAGSLYLNGELEESGVAAAVMGNPVNSVAWLVRKLSEFGVRMKAGQSVLSGSFIRARTIEAGDTVTADFGSLGQISFGVSRLDPASEPL